MRCLFSCAENGISDILALSKTGDQVAGWMCDAVRGINKYKAAEYINIVVF